MTDNTRPQYDAEILKIADYIINHDVNSVLAIKAAQYCLIDSIGCAVLAHAFPACTRLIGSWFSQGAPVHGARVLGTSMVVDPIKAAFDNGMLIRWLDYNDTWLAKEWGHPSDNLGAILSVTDFLGKHTVKDLLTAMIQAYEIQGVLAIENSFNALGLDHVILVKIATAGVITQLLGGTKAQVIDALSQAWVDGQALRTYRHSPNTGSRKSWAAGDATSRGLQLAVLTLKGEIGCPSALSASQWGFNAVYSKESPITLKQPLGTYVIENILFKIVPAEFHAQTAVECALRLHPEVSDKLASIEKIIITTHQAALCIIDKKGPLYTPADRDHCLQYMVAVALIEGRLTAKSYEDTTANNPTIDKLRQKMHVQEDPQYSIDYLDPHKRAIPNALQIILNDGTMLEAECHYPLGHPRRREEAIPLLWEKLEKNLHTHYSPTQTSDLLALMKNDEEFLNMPVRALFDSLIPSGSF